MIIFGKYKFLLKMSGLDPQGGCENSIARIVNSISFFLFSLMMSIFLALNFHRDIDQSLSVGSIIIAHIAIISTYFQLLINRKQFYLLLVELQDIADESV